MSEAARRWLKPALQALLSAGLMYVVVRQIDLRQARTLAVGGTHLLWLLGALLLFNLSKIVGAARLNLYQRQAGILLNDAENLKLYYAGMFLNLFLPGGIGGDGYKILVLNRRGAAPVRTLFKVMLLDRLSGLLILLLLACALLPWLGLPQRALMVFTEAIVGAVATLAVLLLLHRRWAGMRTRQMAAICCYGLVVQLLQLVCMAALLVYVRAATEDTLKFLWLFLVSSVASALPLSVGGLGAREITFLYGARMLALDPTRGVLASSAFFLITALSSMAGAFFFGKFALGRR